MNTTDENFVIVKNRNLIILTGVLGILGISNYAFLSSVVSWQTCHIIMILMIIAFTVYAAAVCKATLSAYQEHEEQQKNTLIEAIKGLQAHIDELEQRDMEFKTKTSMELKANTLASMNKIVEQTTSLVEATREKLKEEIKATGKELKVELESKEEAVLQRVEAQFKEGQNKIEEKTEYVISNILKSKDEGLLKVEEKTKELVDEFSSSNEKMKISLEELNTHIEELDSNSSAAIMARFDSAGESYTKLEASNKEEFGVLALKIEEAKAFALGEIEQASNKVALNHNKLMEVLSQAVESQNEDFGRIEKAYTESFGHISGLSQKTTTQIEKISTLIMQHKQQTELFERLYKTDTAKQGSGLAQLEQKADVYINLAKTQEGLINNKLGNLQEQFRALNSLAEALKNIALVPKLEGNAKQAIEPNRIEKIEDEQTGVTVLNSYKNNIIASSEMLKGKKKIYDVEYAQDGSVASSRNYDKEGQLVTELLYYLNGQVKERKEKILVDGKRTIVITKFDKQGNKQN